MRISPAVVNVRLADHRGDGGAEGTDGLAWLGFGWEEQEAGEGVRLEGVYRFGGGARRHRRRRGGDGRPVRVVRGVRRPPRSARGKRYDLWCLVGCSTAALLRNCGPLDAVGQGCARRRDVLAQYCGPRRYLTPPGALFRWLVPQRGVAEIEGALVHRSRAAARRCHLRGGSLPPARGRGAAQPGHHPAAPPGGPHQRRQAPPRRGPPRRGARGPGPAAVRRRPVPRPPLCLTPRPTFHDGCGFRSVLCALRCTLLY